MMLTPVRLFIALQLNEACKEAIAEVTDAMRAQGIRANYVPEGMRYTEIAAFTHESEETKL